MTTIMTMQGDVGINEAFPNKVCINLDRRPDRWRRMQPKFERHGIQSVRRFAATDGETVNLPPDWSHTPGAYGCLVSHVAVVEEARRLGLAEVLIFEDDVVFDPHFQNKFRSYFRQLPDDWDMLFFGALHKDDPIQISDNISRLTRSNSTYAYALRAAVFDSFIELNRRAETVIDNNSFILQERFNCYCFLPHLAWVETDYSDAQNRLEHHWYLKESLVLFSAQVDRLLSETTVVLSHQDLIGSGRATENLMYLVQYYLEFFAPYIEIVIVEQGAAPTVDAATLPSNCRYLFLEGPFNRDRCFEMGINNSRRRFLILADSDLYLETLDIRANLRMCERYDCTTGFSRIIDLTGADSRLLRKTKTTRGIDITKSASERSNDRRGYCVFGNRQSLQISGESKEAYSARIASPELLKSKRRFRVFESPNHALRLSQE